MAEKRNLDVGVGEKKSKCAKTSSSEGEGDDCTRVYRLLLEEVGKCLNKEALERIARLEGLHERDIDHIIQPNQDSSGALFQCLEEKGILYVNDVSRLRQDLETIGQESAAKLVDKYAQVNFPMKWVYVLLCAVESCPTPVMITHDSHPPILPAPGCPSQSIRVSPVACLTPSIHRARGLPLFRDPSPIPTIIDFSRESSARMI
ncbi:hypothetical protein BSL78_25198 [Apostichopus japonicus]|uniref:Uncharacterized protein n=1 Tax=Stichopus japonicus TaxID=307972 RepID=A0A2G8JQH3_STIJA|nr:hypothetical protein BSL78_25198 [Apostichopus japonicus]